MGVLIKPRKVWRLSGDAKTRDDQTAPRHPMYCMTRQCSWALHFSYVGGIQTKSAK